LEQPDYEMIDVAELDRRMSMRPLAAADDHQSLTAAASLAWGFQIDVVNSSSEARQTGFKGRAWLLDR
jgi:hypothetical protein